MSPGSTSSSSAAEPPTFSAWLARQGARPVGVDVTPAQLETAREMQREIGLEFPLVEANAEDVPLPDASFDLAISEYGASIWCDPYRLDSRGSIGCFVPAGGSSFCASSPLDDPVRGRGARTRRPRAFSGRSEGCTGSTGRTEDVEFHLGHGECIDVLRDAGFVIERLWSCMLRTMPETHPYYSAVTAGAWATEVAVGGSMGGTQDRLTLASTCPQRRAILEQLAIPFDVVAPDYVEDDPPDADPTELVRRHAEGKARSVHADGRITLGVDTTVVLDGRVYGKARNADDATRMLARARRAERTRSSPASACSAPVTTCRA